ncbi:Cif family virulence factor [Jiella marina]|uniref:hypothetical protein n=1 Tax=Jiella sp. LLJ827 TaxID=2917712 RepID=UPI002100CB40|nr:hypothetical protein [Jiella sp. LLJ827]MCQ0987017.1 hypothetical protein [Jiella sp. LLJ827]
MSEGEAPFEAVEAASLPVAIEAVFRAYAEGFDDFDADRILGCFAYPVTIWQLDKGNIFVDEEELAENIEALLAVYETEGIVRSDFAALDAAISGNTALVTLAWRQERIDGDAAMEFVCRYTLRRGGSLGESWRIVLAVNEEPGEDELEDEEWDGSEATDGNWDGAP